MPAAVVLIRDGRSVAEVSGRFASVFGRPLADLLGSDLLRFVVPADAALVASVIHEARTAAGGSAPASAVARFEQPDGSRHVVEVSAAHRADVSGRGSTVVLLRPQTVWHGLNASLIPHGGHGRDGELAPATASVPTAAQVAVILASIAGFLGCEPISHDCYFLRSNESSGVPVLWSEPGSGPDVPTLGPFEDVLAGREPSLTSGIASLPADLQEYAGPRRYTALRCVPVRASHRDGIVGCLVGWDRKEHTLPEMVDMTFRYAAEIASLAAGRTGLPAAAPMAPALPWPTDIDIVTGLPLERTLVRSLDEMTASGQRPGLVFIRLTALAGLAEALGDFTRDQLMRVAARRASSLIRMTDELYRTGDDGLVIVCTGDVDGTRLAEISARVQERLEVPFRVESEPPLDVKAVVTSLHSPSSPLGGAEFLAAMRSLMV